MVNKNYRLGNAIREGTFIVAMSFILGMIINSVVPITDPQLGLAVSFIISWLITVGAVFIYHRRLSRGLGSRRR